MVANGPVIRAAGCKGAVAITPRDRLAADMNGTGGTQGSAAATWTRRDFVSRSAAMAAVSGVIGSAHLVGASTTATTPKPLRPRPERYRAVSWWLTFEDLAWPNSELQTKIQRRADACAASAVNCCLIFGAHFRWDFLPLWSRLHDLLHTIAGELHQRNILLFDHHSSVLTHRPRDAAGARAIWQRNRHHVPFYPSAEAAATWEINGSRLNDWRMRDVQTGDAVFLPAYEAEQYCMNHPAFRAAYADYVRRLLAETGIDGLMSDDGIFYADWRACACQHCRARFQREYGHELPPVSDTSFWGNRRSAAFRDWIELRFRSSGEFLEGVRAVLPKGFPLLTCCSSSDGHALPAYGMSYQDFIRSCDHVLLEMVGSTPGTNGTWDNRIPSQMLHLGIAAEHRVPCFGLGYGFFPDTAFFIWALNKFLGSDCWFSTLKGRLNASSEQLAALADDPALVAEGFRWEQAHPQLFRGEVDTDLAVLFSRSTRDFYGQVAADYTADFQATCLQLMRRSISYVVVTRVPESGRVRRLVLSSAICLSPQERRAIDAFLAAGGTVLAVGPCGFCDARGNPAELPWLAEKGLPVEWIDPPRTGGFPPYKHYRTAVAVAEGRVTDASRRTDQDGWYQVAASKGRLLWRPERMAAKGVADAVTSWVNAGAAPAALDVRALPASWQSRRFRDGNRWLIHALPGKVGVVLHASLRDQMSQQGVIETLQFRPVSGTLTLSAAASLQRVTLHSPDLPEPRAATRNAQNDWSIDLEGVRRYFVVEVVAAGAG